ncbi:hypothetical protein [Pseudomonas sp. SK2]|uniref:hypothetical protein n=1 Tax=Pseudomonas sp. SK2 TaxID=2841063 RepID=UPI00192AB08A|nr:hypothetical protein [Pseudomonas sp. SK2]QQZ36906.1 hypothetical protein IF103_02910 [Pseudomonas sp. SK2]
MTATREKQTLQLLADENLFVFSDNVTELVREASRDSHALATQAANKKYHPTKEVEAWFEEYLRIMGATGWTALKYEVNKVTESGSYVEMSNLFYQGLQSAYGSATGDIRQSLKDLGGAVMEALQDSKIIKLPGTRTREDDRVSISLCKCAQSESGEVVMLVCALQNDELPDRKGETLLGKWEHRGATTYACAASLSFSRRRYNNARELIELKLDAKAREVLAELKLD